MLTFVNERVLNSIWTWRRAKWGDDGENDDEDVDEVEKFFGNVDDV